MSGGDEEPLEEDYDHRPRHRRGRGVRARQPARAREAAMRRACSRRPRVAALPHVVDARLTRSGATLRDRRQPCGARGRDALYRVAALARSTCSRRSSTSPMRKQRARRRSRTLPLPALASSDSPERSLVPGVLDAPEFSAVSADLPAGACPARHRGVEPVPVGADALDHRAPDRSSVYVGPRLRSARAGRTDP
jgi:hypothetical protein